MANPTPAQPTPLSYQSLELASLPRDSARAISVLILGAISKDHI